VSLRYLVSIELSVLLQPPAKTRTLRVSVLRAPSRPIGPRVGKRPCPCVRRVRGLSYRPRYNPPLPYPFCHTGPPATTERLT